MILRIRDYCSKLPSSNHKSSDQFTLLNGSYLFGRENVFIKVVAFGFFVVSSCCWQICIINWLTVLCFWVTCHFQYVRACILDVKMWDLYGLLKQTSIFILLLCTIFVQYYLWATLSKKFVSSFSSIEVNDRAFKIQRYLLLPSGRRRLTG